MAGNNFFRSFRKIIALSLTLLFLSACTKDASMNLKTTLTSTPDSFDPVDYDLFVHHIIQNSVLAPLITKYSSKEGYFPIIAKSWKSERDNSKWTFEIRENLTFSNGKKITPSDVVLSFKRIAFLQKKKGSKNNWTSFLQGIDDFESIQSNLSGISADGNHIILHFSKPIPDLLEEISFGIYSIVSADDFNIQDGKWNDPRKVTSSYQYELVKWDDDNKQINLKLREFNFSPSVNKYKAITINWDSSKQKNSQIIMASSFENSPGEEYTFYGPTKAGIFYLHLWNWDQKKSEFSDLSFRKTFRELLYRELKKQNVQVIRSFFPLAITGVKENPSSEIISNNVSKKNGNVTFVRQANLENSQFRKDVQRSLENLLKQNNISFVFSSIPAKDTRLWHDPSYKEEKADISIRATSILVESPDHDMRFMFLSREGICLPDTDGTIHKELEKDKLDYNKINQMLWEQAAIIPINHYSLGIRVNNEVDLSQYNINLPPIDFTFIQSK